MRLLLIFVLQLALAFFTGGAQAQTITNSTLSGTVVSASTNLPPSPGSVTVFTTPEVGFFILTQFCAGGGIIADLTFSGSTFGKVPIPTFASNFCTSYIPGIAFPQGETLSCTTRFPSDPDTPTACMVTGVLSER